MLRMNRLFLNNLNTVSRRTLSTNINSLKSLSKNKSFTNTMYGLAYLIGAVGIGHEIYKNNVKKPIVLESQFINGAHPLYVKSKDQFQSAGTDLLTGRCGGKKIKTTNSITGEIEYYYQKTSYDYRKYLKELFVGALGKMLLNENMPKVYAVETTDNHGNSFFSLASQSLGFQHKNYVSTLENWIQLLGKDEEEALTLNPFKSAECTHNLGLIIAFNALIGKEDEKLSNIAFSLNLNESAFFYSIDNESALQNSSIFIKDAKLALGCIGEFAKKTLNERITEDQCHGLDVADDPRFPLKANKELLEIVKPMLVSAIEKDIQQGAICNLYQNFASLSKGKIESIFDQFGTIFSISEKQIIMDDILMRQKATQEHLLNQGPIQELPHSLQRLGL